MKNMKRILLTVVSALLLMAVTVAGTLAYLQAQTDAVVNTFTFGNVKFADQGLDEADVNEYGVPVNAEGLTEAEHKEAYKDNENPPAWEPAKRVLENEYKLLPGHTYTKDPTVHIAPKTEPSWVFIKVVNGIANIEATTNTIASQIEKNHWKKLTGQVGADGKEITDVYYYETTVDTLDPEAQLDLLIFSTFTLQDGLQQGAMEKAADAEIWIDAYLIQADGLETPEEAWSVAQPEFAK